MEEVLGSEVRPTCREDQERIWSIHIGPTRWQRADATLARLAEEHPLLAPSVAVSDQLVFVTAQRMKRVRHAESLRITATTGS